MAPSWGEAAPDPKVLIADLGYDGDAIRADVEARCGTPVIPTKRNHKLQIPVDGFIYGLRNRDERGIRRLNNVRRVTTQCDKTTASYLGLVQLIAVRLWLRHVVNTV